MKKNVRTEFVEELRKALPKHTNAAIYLTDLLGLGKETVYRRLRGTVPFTLDEAAEVARKLGISLDRLIGLTHAENAGTEFHLNYFKDFYENYNELVSDSLRALNKVSQDPSGTYIVAANRLPYRFYTDYKALADFRYKRWLHERGEVATFRSAEIEAVPVDYQKHKFEIRDAFDGIAETYMIWDANVFRSLVNEIRYFRVLSLINDEDVGVMRNELLEMLDELERLMMKGRTKEGKRIYFYLSNVILDTSYSYLEAEGYKMSCFHVYGRHTIQSESAYVCGIQKAWLHTILRHSTLITQSGEIERAAFFKDQRAIIEKM